MLEKYEPYCRPQVLISYDSLYCILTAPHTLVPLSQELCRQPEPENIQDILQRIIFIGQSE